MTRPIDTSAKLDIVQQKFLQRVTGKFLYYARAVDPTMLHALSILATEQTTGNQSTVAAMSLFLNYCATNPDSILRYHASDMILRVESDASYLTEPNAKSRAGGHHYLGRKCDNQPWCNGPLLSLSKVLRNVMSSAAEAEIGALFINAREATVLRMALIEMGHPQPATPIATDNSTAAGIMNKSVKQVRSKAIDMRFYWVRDRVEQEQFTIFWAPGRTNYADYYTKHHPPSHHRPMRPIITGRSTAAEALAYLQGCVKATAGPTGTVRPSSVPRATSAGRQQRDTAANQ